MGVGGPIAGSVVLSLRRAHAIRDEEGHRGLVGCVGDEL